jgi:hypothetical protein
MRKTKAVVIFAGLLVCLLTFDSTAWPQRKGNQSSAPDVVSGHYEGHIKTSTRGDVPVSLDLRLKGEKMSGALHTPFGEIIIMGGIYEEGRLTIYMEANGDEATFAGRLAGGQVKGDFNGFGETGTVELKRTRDAPPVPDTSIRLSLSKAAWREDLQFLAREIPKRHKNAFHTITREQFARAVAELDAQIPKLDDDRIVLGLSRIAAMIGDGHTRLNWYWAYLPAPLSFFWFGQELRVTSAMVPYVPGPGKRVVGSRRAVGTRVVSIGGASVDEALARAQPFLHHGENEWYVKGESALMLAYPAFLHAIGLAPDAEHARYTFEDDKGKRFTLNLKQMTGGVPFTMVNANPTKFYGFNEYKPLWHTYLPETQTVYFNFTAYPSRTAFKKFAQELFAFIDNNPVKRFVVDMRQNGGGDFTRGREYIISEIKKRDRINRRGHLFVIIGRWTYSAGMANAADFRNQTNAILVGEPTGGRPNGYQENREFMLPNSHLSVWVSTEFYKFQEQDTPGLMPDHRIDPDWAAYSAGRDPVLEWIQKQ